MFYLGQNNWCSYLHNRHVNEWRFLKRICLSWSEKTCFPVQFFGSPWNVLFPLAWPCFFWPPRCAFFAAFLSCLRPMDSWWCLFVVCLKKKKIKTNLVGRLDGILPEITAKIPKCDRNETRNIRLLKMRNARMVAVTSW